MMAPETMQVLIAASLTLVCPGVFIVVAVFFANKLYDWRERRKDNE